MSFAENLYQAMHAKRCKAVDIARATNITPSVISRYLSGTNQPSTDNLFAIANYLGMSPDVLLSSSDAPESKKPVQPISSDKDKVIMLLERMVAERDETIASLKAEVKEWEDWKATSKDRHAKGRTKTKNPTKPKKQKVGFLRKRKPSKK